MWQQTCSVCWASTGSEQKGKKKLLTTNTKQTGSPPSTRRHQVNRLLMRLSPPRGSAVAPEVGRVFWRGGGLLGGKWPGSFLLNNIQNKQKGTRKQRTLPAARSPPPPPPPHSESCMCFVELVRYWLSRYFSLAVTHIQQMVIKPPQWNKYTACVLQGHGLYSFYHLCFFAPDSTGEALAWLVFNKKKQKNYPLDGVISPLLKASPPFQWSCSLSAYGAKKVFPPRFLVFYEAHRASSSSVTFHHASVTHATHQGASANQNEPGDSQLGI